VFKAIPMLVNPAEVNLGFALGQIVNNYNAKPFLTGPKYHTFSKGDNWLEVDVDLHLYQMLARKTFWGLSDEIRDMVIDFGMVVESRSDEEMPEQILGAMRISKPDIHNCPRID